MKWLFLTLILIPGLVLGTENNDCDHPRFLEKGCGYEGEQGPKGDKGEKGDTGEQGPKGDKGDRGERGPAGVVDYTRLEQFSSKWEREIRIISREYARTMAATTAIDAPLPIDGNQRVTFGLGYAAGQVGAGLGYSYMNDDNTSFTIGIGVSGQEYVGRTSVGMEFGRKNKNSKYVPFRECTYVNGKLEYKEFCVAAD